MDLQFKTIYSPWDNTQYWSVCNTVEDDATDTATVFNGINQKKMFFEVIEEIVEDIQSGGEGLLRFNDVQNLASSYGMTVADGGQFLHKLNQYKWLKTVRNRSGEAHIAPGPRSLLELPQLRTLALKKNMQTKKRRSQEITPPQSQADEEDEITPVRPRKKLSRRPTQESNEEDEIEEAPSEPRTRSQPRRRSRTASQYIE